MALNRRFNAFEMRVKNNSSVMRKIMLFDQAHRWITGAGISRAVTPRNRRSAVTRSAYRAKTPDETTVSSILNTFLEGTQITWVYYVCTRRSFWRAMWIMIIVCGIAMAMVQSRKALTGYLGYDVSLQTTYMLNATLPFPAITICSNSPVRWFMEESSNSSIYNEIMTRLRDENERNKYNAKFKKKGKPYEEYLLFDVLKSFPFPSPSYGVVSSVYWNGTKYFADGTSGPNFQSLEERRIVKLMHDLYYGDCLIFNAGVDNETTLDASALTAIQFTLDWDSRDRFPDLNDPAVILLIHPAGTAPIFGDGNNFKVYPRDEVTVGIKERLIERLPHPYPSHCVPDNKYPLRANSVYYETNRPYLYSIDACINTCIQRLSLEICNCWDYLIPLGLLRSEPRFPSSSVCASRCSKVDSSLNLDLCKCYLPCKETTLDLSYAVKSNLVTEIINSEIVNQNSNVTLPPTVAPPPPPKTIVKVFLKTSMYEFSNEVPKYTVADFWGIVGGNAAFWIGISAVSLFEIVELCAQLGHFGVRKEAVRRFHVVSLDNVMVGSGRLNSVQPGFSRGPPLRTIREDLQSVSLDSGRSRTAWDESRYDFTYNSVNPLLTAFSLRPYYGQPNYGSTPTPFFGNEYVGTNEVK